MAPRVLISDALSPAAVAIFKERGVDVDFQPALGKDKDKLAAIIGDYDDADLVPEWQWVKRMASHEHVGVKDDSAYEFTLNLAMELDAIPPALQPLIAAAQQAGVNYILFYNG